MDDESGKWWMEDGKWEIENGISFIHRPSTIFVHPPIQKNSSHRAKNLIV